MGQTLDEFAAVQREIAALDAQLTDKRNQRDALYDRMNGQVMRVRAGIKAIYGDDASEYGMVGGTRRSERKVHARRAKV